MNIEKASDVEQDSAGAIDAVVTWVDGNDPGHKRKRALALKAQSANLGSTIPAGIDNTRFEDNGEIEYCLRSIRKFAPWIRTIFLVTDKQRPEFLDEAERIRLGVVLVDHQVVFEGYEDVLPTFNSLSIGTMLHRIPNLAPRYIYFNDDCILLRPTYIEDFFDSNRVVLRGEWKRLTKFGKTRLFITKALNYVLKKLFGINRAMSVLQQMKGARLAGATNKFFKYEHTPHPFVRKTLSNFFSENEVALRSNITYKFRNFDQYAVTSLGNHLELNSGAALVRPGSDAVMICFNRDKKAVIENKVARLKTGKIKFLCVQSFEQATGCQRAQILSLLQERV